jgi:hypothetical protein
MQILIVIAFVAIAVLMYRAVTKRRQHERRLTNLRRALIPAITLLVIAAMQYGAGSRPDKPLKVAEQKKQAATTSQKPLPKGHSPQAVTGTK